jgi:hypothetical protein
VGREVCAPVEASGAQYGNHHTLVTELAESGAGDEVIMSIAGHVSRAMLSRYSNVRMEAKRRALDEIAARQRAADVRRREQAERSDPQVVEAQVPESPSRLQWQRQDRLPVCRRFKSHLTLESGALGYRPPTLLRLHPDRRGGPKGVRP